MPDRPVPGAHLPPIADVADGASRQTLLAVAEAIKPGGRLRRFTPKSPEWCRRIGADVFNQVYWGQVPDPTEVWLLREAYRRASEKQKKEEEFAEKERELKALVKQDLAGGM